MSWIAAAALGAGVAGSYMSAQAQKQATSEAAGVSSAASDRAIAEQSRQFDEIKKILSPYVSAGELALGEQMGLVGLKGPDTQRQIYQQFQESPEFQAIAKQQENAILQNAAATGGLRGGNVQSALAQFRPNLLNQMIQQRFSNLGQLTMSGQQGAQSQAGYGQQSAGNISGALLGQGSMAANAALARGRQDAQLFSDIGSLGAYVFGRQGGLF